MTGKQVTVFVCFLAALPIAYALGRHSGPKEFYDWEKDGL